MPGDAVADDKLAAALVRREQAASRLFLQALADMPRDEIALKPFNLVGLTALRQLLSDAPPSAGSAGAATRTADLSGVQPLAALVDEIAADGHGLVMVMGKGGVGKTTLAAAVAVSSRTGACRCI